MAVSALGVLSLASCMNTNQQDPWWNTGDYGVGTYYFESMEGTRTSEDIKFDESSYFVVTALADYDEKTAYEKMIGAEAPIGLWDWVSGMSDEGEYLYLKMEWFNCYFAEMPSFNSIGSSPEGQIFQAIDEKTVDGETVRNEWYYDYQELFDSEKIKNGIFAIVELHEENDALSEVRISFEIPDVCDLVMYFSFVAAS